MSGEQTAAPDVSTFHRALTLIPAAAYTCDAQGLITWFNAQAVELWGRAPSLNHPTDRYCGSYRLLSAHSVPIAHDACWMALALRERREYLAQEIVIERNDGSRATALAYATPLNDGDGNLIGAINILVDISERKHTEELLVEASRANEFYRATLADAMRDELARMQDSLARLAADGGDPVAIAKHIAALQQRLAQLAALVNELVDIKAKASGIARDHQG